ncbi:proline-rich receptor-like protein kinase PERK9 [Phragmites australis]|uniref:proline-rich receptor-like protein kinase PERK9 n=1 Tax=Phragmites australis TaxID=29695 RepID=UPI002D77BAA1|nr:proline-rich receptor-like protein kinase PERK9 [Phragmites australis]
MAPLPLLFAPVRPPAPPRSAPPRRLGRSATSSQCATPPNRARHGVKPLTPSRRDPPRLQPGRTDPAVPCHPRAVAVRHGEPPPFPLLSLCADLRRPCAPSRCCRAPLAAVPSWPSRHLAPPVGLQLHRAIRPPAVPRSHLCVVLPSCVLVRRRFTAPANLLSSRRATLSSSLIPLLGRRPAQPPCASHSWSRRAVQPPPAAGSPPGRRAHHLSISSGCSAPFFRPPPPGLLPSREPQRRRFFSAGHLPLASSGSPSLFRRRRLFPLLRRHRCPSLRSPPPLSEPHRQNGPAGLILPPALSAPSL